MAIDLANSLLSLMQVWNLILLWMCHIIIFLFLASLLKDLRHTNIVTLHDIVHTTDTLTFVFEYVVRFLSPYS